MTSVVLAVAHSGVAWDTSQVLARVAFAAAAEPIVVPAAVVRYEPMRCRRCGRMMQPRALVVSKRRKASSFDTCIYQCARCGIGYSNGADAAARIPITRTPARNVPRSVRRGLSPTLRAAANVGNRAAKAEKFCSGSSEDAVTWTIFRWLHDAHALDTIAIASGEAPPQGEPEVLLWGARVGGGKSALGRVLRDACLAVGEDSQWLTEPDVIVCWPDLLCFVEVKYRSKNDRQADHPYFGLYTRTIVGRAHDAFARSPEEVAADGWYELARNWRIGTDAAKVLGRRFILVNLAPARLKSEAEAFARGLMTGETRGFVFVSWRDLLAKARDRVGMPPELTEYVAMRELETMWG